MARLGVARPDAQRAPPPEPEQEQASPQPEQAVSPPGPAENAGHVILVRATDVDVASAARGIAGVTRVTREAGEIWNISADRDVSAEVARRIADKGLLKFLISVKPGEKSAFMQWLTRHEA